MMQARSVALAREVLHELELARDLIRSPVEARLALDDQIRKARAELHEEHTRYVALLQDLEA
jgi:hypothetical protein